ncbi:MAG: hypothetical protein O7C75_00700, partial [Verrucomicrobia bacterium]|nr:hypothetical protein [Verrucomicrobiota bacterium]
KAYEDAPFDEEFRRYHDHIQSRLIHIRRKKIRQEIDNPTDDPIQKNAVAVMSFSSPTGNRDLSHLAQSIPWFVRGVLRRLNTAIEIGEEKIEVVAGEEIEVLEKEIALTQSPIFDQQTAPQAGKFLKANWVITGAVGTLDEKNYVDVNSTEMMSESFAHDQLDLEMVVSENTLKRFWGIIAALTKYVAENRMGFDFPEKKYHIEPTQSLIAFMAFSEGLERFYLGEYKKAADKFEDAFIADPNFADASDMRASAVKRQKYSRFRTLDNVEGAIRREQEIAEDLLRTTGTGLGFSPIKSPPRNGSQNGPGNGGKNGEKPEKVPITITIEAR